MQDFIYNLHFIEGKKQVRFYIGRTINMHRRFGEHKLGAKHYKSGDEWVYEFASTLDALQITWDMELEVACGDNTDDFEDFFINKYLLLGEPLQNMKKGDSEPWMGRHYNTPEDFVAEKQRILTLPKPNVEKIKRAHDTEPTRFADFINPHIPAISAGTAALLARRKKS